MEVRPPDVDSDKERARADSGSDAGDDCGGPGQDGWLELQVALDDGRQELPRQLQVQVVRTRRHSDPQVVAQTPPDAACSNRLQCTCTM